MEGAQKAPVRRSVEEVFRDFRGRREGVLKALTTDVERFYEECDPEKDNLCLYGLPTGLWEVNTPIEEVPPDIPDPILGINFSKEGMRKSEWLLLIAIHSDAWLTSLAFYFGARFKFDRIERKRLFAMVNSLPTLYEVLSEKQKEQQSTTQTNGNKTKPSGKMPKSQSSVVQAKREQITPPPVNESNSDEEEADVQESTLCGACDDDSGVDQFWIFCDVCKRWFHGKCVEVTSAMAKHINLYKCPSCRNKKSRVH